MGSFARRLRTIPSVVIDFATSKWVRVEGDSMMPTIRSGGIVRVSRRSYWRATPSRWDVALIQHPRRRRFFELKRIVGLPGEVIEIRDGDLLVNRAFLEDPHSENVGAAEVWRWELAADQYVVLGDNRSASSDSRSFGPLNRRLILGKAILSDR